eukprot:CAMPEP_0204545760 /NCGR_PEP_ID=MMETSP0661-20131031/21508_1 /ASSEMBLY_ACC=CAM_ASM_000606 /TAXON_ID=109239 /ORGANISM="Alexandrium margalefi, Strain AMGDE01CS-322" /LENGTH=52 /DNA_ID=CAMNT_0051552557 /DNA_START=26 /DNA_END=180 /DNA_ORIENTATION=-
MSSAGASDAARRLDPAALDGRLRHEVSRRVAARRASTSSWPRTEDHGASARP